jgi:hypothetical protein
VAAVADSPSPATAEEDGAVAVAAAVSKLKKCTVAVYNSLLLILFVIFSTFDRCILIFQD